MENQISKQEFWQRHVREGYRHREGVGAYCREHGLTLSAFYNWKKKVLGFEKARAVALSPFVGVAVERGGGEGQLPDAKWLGEFAAQLIRSLR